MKNMENIKTPSMRMLRKFLGSIENSSNEVFHKLSKRRSYKYFDKYKLLSSSLKKEAVPNDTKKLGTNFTVKC